MKRIFNLSLLALAALTFFTACDIQEITPDKPVVGAKVLTAYTDDAKSTKTSLNGTSIVWNVNDHITAFTSDYTGYTSTNVDVQQEGRVAEFTIGSLTTEDDVVMAIYPANPNATMSDDHVITTELSEEQFAVPNSFANGANLSIATGLNDVIKFKNAGAIFSITLANDNVKKIKLTSISSTPVAGPCTVSITDNGVVCTPTRDSQNESVTLFAPENECFAANTPYYFVLLPGIYSDGLRLEFTSSDGKIAKLKNSTGITVQSNDNYNLGTMPDLSTKWKEIKSNKFVMVTEEPSTWVGEYLIAYCPDANTARVFNGKDAADDYVAGVITDNSVTLAEGMAVVSIESMTGGYALKITNGDKAGNYIYGKSGSNSIQYGVTAVANEISFDEIAVTILSNETSLRYNSASGNDRFRYYKTATTGASYFLPTLFKREGEIQTVAVTGVAVAPTTASIAVGMTINLKATIIPENATNKNITWASDNTDVATIDESGHVTAVATGNTTITATSDDGGHVATCTLSVSESVSASISSFIAADESSTTWYKLTGEITDIKNAEYGDFTITDATGDVYVYGLVSEYCDKTTAFREKDLAVGDVITIIGKRGAYGDTQEVVGAYYVSHSPAPAISLNPTSLTYIAAGESKSVAVTTQNFAGNVTITAQSNNAQFSTSISGTTVTITATENTSTSDVNGTVTITASDGVSEMSVDVTLIQYGKVSAVDATDVIDKAFTEVTGTSYTNWDKKASNSVARYSGNSAGGNSSVQLRAESPSGIVSTVSGGYMTKVEVVWNTSTASGRKVQIFGSNTAYVSPADLYDSDKRGTLLGTIDYGSTTELAINGEYQYVGIRSSSGSLYLTSISITWSATAPEPPVLTDLIWTGYTASYTEGAQFSVDGTIKAVYDNGSEKILSNGDYTLTVSPDLSAAGTTFATISYTEGGVTKTATATITVTSGSGAGTDQIVTWTATSGGLGSEIGTGTIKTGDYSWNYTRTLKSGDSYTGWTSNCIQLGKNGGVENISISTSNIPGTIKSVSVECSSYNNAHKVSISVGGTSYKSSQATAKWTTVDTITGTGTSSGKIVINITDGTRALYIKSISVTYTN